MFIVYCGSASAAPTSPTLAVGAGSWCSLSSFRLSKSSFVHLCRAPDPVNHPLGTHLCGATLLTRDWIITRAYCVSGNQPLDFYSVNIAGTQLVGPDDGVARAIAAIAVHPAYNADTGVFDVALLQLAQPFDGITAKLPSATMGGFGANLRVLGWGVSDLSARTLNNRLLSTTVTVRSDRECASLYGAHYDPATQLCANGKYGQGACLGDDGEWQRGDA